MVIPLVLASILMQTPEVTVTVPDTVQAGEVFQCLVSIEGQDLSNIGCEPVYSEDLEYMGLSTMSSFSSVSTPSGTRISSSVTLTMSFAAYSEGIHSIGPLTVTSSGRTIQTTEKFSVTAVGSLQRSPGSSYSAQERESGEAIAWMEVEVDTTCRIYPGQTFQAHYYICKTMPSAQVVDLYLEPSDYATSRLSEEIEELQWVRQKDGTYRTWLATMDITPAFACSLSLPVLRGRIGLPGGIIRPSREYVISTEGATVPVYPFPRQGMPVNFDGLTGELSFTCQRVNRGYSPGGEKCILVTASGPGSSRLHRLPDLTVQGPASLLQGGGVDNSAGERTWNILVEPSDSGMVIVGPDSVAWFDTGSETYRQAVIPACTLSVYPIRGSTADLSFLDEDNGSSTSFWLVTVSVMLLLSIILVMRFRSRISGPADVMDACDVEELLTALGDRLSIILTGSRSYMGSEVLDEVLDKSSIDSIVARRLLRHWKDLELLLSGRKVSEEQLGKLRNKSRELISEVEAELYRSRQD